MLTYKQGISEILQGVSMNSYVNKYIPRFEEFEIDHYTLPKEERVVFPTVTGPSIFLVTTGKGTMTEDHLKFMKSPKVMFFLLLLTPRLTSQILEISCKLAESLMFFLLLLTPRLTSRILEISCKLAQSSFVSRVLDICQLY